MNIYKKDKNIIIEIPYLSKRSNPYTPDEDVGEHQTLIGICCLDEFGNEELGFAQVIDMDYKDKGDQWTDIKYHWWGDKDKFIEKCKELGIDCYEYPVCAYCKKSIYGCFTTGDKGNMCSDCERKGEK